MLAGQTVILTGAAGGIGRHIARALADEGARVGLTDLAAEPLDAVVHDLGETPLVAEAFDAADAERINAVHARVREELGEVDGLVTCAGRWLSKPFDEIPVAELEEMFRANASTAFAACRAVLPAMIERGSG